jgi:hypothetical protein
VRVIKEENKKFKNQRSKIKMTNQNAEFLAFALSLRIPIYRDEAIPVGALEIATLPPACSP